MFYLALLLIMAGILIFVYSVFHKSIEGDRIRNRLAFFTKKKVPVYEAGSADQREKARVPERVFQDDRESPEIIVRELPGREIGSENGEEKPGGPRQDHLSRTDAEVIRDEDIIIADTYDDRDRREETTQGSVPAGEGGEAHDHEPERVPVNAVETSRKKAGDTVDFVLYDDSSSVINYSSSGGFIDPTLEEYRKIRRVGRGNVLLDRDGVSFYQGTKLFRFDFHRLKEVVTGDNFMALFISGSETVKLFIADRGNDVMMRIKEKFSQYSSLNTPS